MQNYADTVETEEGKCSMNIEGGKYFMKIVRLANENKKYSTNTSFLVELKEKRGLSILSNGEICTILPIRIYC